MNVVGDGERSKNVLTECVCKDVVAFVDRIMFAF